MEFLPFFSEEGTEYDILCVPDEKDMRSNEIEPAEELFIGGALKSSNNN